MRTNLSDLAKSLHSHGGDIRALLDDPRGTLKRNDRPESFHQFDGLSLTVEVPHSQFTTQTVNNLSAATSTALQITDDKLHNFIKETIVNPESLGKYGDQKLGSVKAGFATKKSLSAAFNDRQGVNHTTHSQEQTTTQEMRTEMQWRQTQLLIAAHIDIGRPLARIICYGRGKMSQYGKTEWTPHSSGIVIDIEDIKCSPSSELSREQPIIFLRYAEFDRSVQSTMGIFSPSEKVNKKNDVTGDKSSVEESDLNLYLTQEEITLGISVLFQNSELVDPEFLKKLAVKKSFIFSFLRPPKLPELPSQKEEEMKKEETQTHEDEVTDMMPLADQSVETKIKNEDYGPARKKRILPIENSSSLSTPNGNGKSTTDFNPYRDVHPTSVGPDGVPPTDIWDGPSTSICLDLKQLCLDNIPTNAYAEHEKFWVRVLLPLIGKGPQSVVDKNFTMNIKVTERHSSYAVMRDFVKEHGKKGLKGFFPARRHGDFLRIYLQEIDVVNQAW